MISPFLQNIFWKSIIVATMITHVMPMTALTLNVRRPKWLIQNMMSSEMSVITQL